MLKLTENHNPNYVAHVCRVTEIRPIKGADRVVEAIVNGCHVVTGKSVREGDIVIYFPVESQLDQAFLAANNLYSFDLRHQNFAFAGGHAANLNELYQTAVNEGNDEMADTLRCHLKEFCGMFDAKGRVKIKQIRGIYSQGFICTPKFIENLVDEEIDWESLVGESFDSIRDWDRPLVKKYQLEIPVDETSDSSQKRWRKTMKRLLSYDCMIPGQFQFHYDTVKAEFGLNDIHPDDNITLTVKVDGSSVIIANTLTRFKPNIFQRMLQKFGKQYPDTVYRPIYASRRSIKNRWVRGRGNRFYDKDIHGFVFRDFKNVLAPGMTVYGEIVGYQEKTNKFIQTNHDYGCKMGEWKFMPYRITTTTEDGTVSEWEMGDIDLWCDKTRYINPKLYSKLMSPVIVYSGKARDLYPDLPEENWAQHFIDRLHEDKNFYMELDEPLCKCKVPREGLVLRIKNDIKPRAWKIKTARHLAREGKENDEGKANIEDIS